MLWEMMCQLNACALVVNLCLVGVYDTASLASTVHPALIANGESGKSLQQFHRPRVPAERRPRSVYAFGTEIKSTDVLNV